MNSKDKIAIVNTVYDIFSIKTGKIYKKHNECYQAHKWVSLFFKVYYSGPVFFVQIAMYLGLPHLFKNIYIQMIETLILFLLIEILLIFFIPMKKIHCWEGVIA